MKGVVVGSMLVVGGGVVVGGRVDIVVTGATVVGGLVKGGAVVIWTGGWVPEGSSLSNTHSPLKHTPCLAV